METRCNLEHGHQTQGAAPHPHPIAGQVQGCSPTLQEGTGAGGELHPGHWPNVQAGSYLCCYHITSSSSSSAGSINGRSCFPQGMSTVGKPRRGGSSIYTSLVSGLLESNGARRVPTASGAAASPVLGAGSPMPAAPALTPIPKAGCGRCCSLFCGTHSSIPEEPPSLCHRVPAEPAQHRGGSETMTMTLRGAGGPTKGPSHSQNPLYHQTHSVTPRSKASVQT